MSKKRFWEIKNSSKQNEGEILLYGNIGTWDGWDDVTAKQFAKDLKDLGDIDVLNVRINSVGGDVFAGQAIHSMLRSHKATVNVYVDGLAASIASVVAMAGDTITMPKNAMMMIHNPWSWGSGNAADFRKIADDLDKIGESIIAAYEIRCNKTRDEIKAIMDAETWLTAEEAVELGFADCLDEGKQVAASLNNGVYNINGQAFDLSKFNHADKLYKCTIPTKKEESQVMEITASILKDKYPAVHAELLEQGRNDGYNAGVEAERSRIKGLEDIVTPGCEEIINKAKYETFATAEKTAIDVLNHLKANPQKPIVSPLAAVVADAAILGQVSNSMTPEAEAAAKEKAQADVIKNAMIDGANSRV